MLALCITEALQLVTWASLQPSDDIDLHFKKLAFTFFTRPLFLGLVGIPKNTDTAVLCNETNGIRD
jgi:hypothetical protein